MSRHPGRGGFSLVEIMAVVVILGMMGAVAFVSWQALLPGARFNSAVRSLSERLAGTRSEAISRNAIFEIHYDLDAERYWVQTPYRVGGGFATDEDEERLRIEETDLSESGVEIVQVIIDEEVYSDGEVYVRFDPLGASSAHTIHVFQPIFEREATIEVLPLTGEIRFHDGFFERDLPREGAFD